MTIKPSDRSPDSPASAAEVPRALAEIHAALARQEQAAEAQHDALQATLAGLTEQLDGLAERLLGTPGAAPAAIVRPAPVERVVERVVEAERLPAVAAPAAADEEWSAILLGPELASEDDLAADREQLVDDVRSGDGAACGLVGQLLVFRSAASERLPVLLKDIGEAWYRWRPEASVDDAFQDGVIRMLQQTCAAGGLSNRIELVHLGDRYDSARHNTRDRGVEVSGVYGWVVLRENGSVYTKANVAVK